MIGAIRQDLELFACEDWPLEVTIVDEAGAAKDIAGGSAVWVLKESAEGLEEIRRETGNGITIGGGTGKLTVSVPESATQSLAAGEHYHELQVTVGLVTRKVAWGVVTVRPTGIRS